MFSLVQAVLCIVHLLLCLGTWLILFVKGMNDSRFPIEGRYRPWGGSAKQIFGKIFLKLHGNEEIWAERWRDSVANPQSATFYDIYICNYFTRLGGYASFSLYEFD